MKGKWYQLYAKNKRIKKVSDTSEILINKMENVKKEKLEREQKESNLNYTQNRSSINSYKIFDRYIPFQPKDSIMLPHETSFSKLYNQKNNKEIFSSSY